MRLRPVLFPDPCAAVDWHASCELQRVSLLAILRSAFPHFVAAGLRLRGGPLDSLRALKVRQLAGTIPLYRSPHNRGAQAVVEELQALPCFTGNAESTSAGFPLRLSSIADPTSAGVARPAVQIAAVPSPPLSPQSMPPPGAVTAPPENAKAVAGVVPAAGMRVVHPTYGGGVILSTHKAVGGGLISRVSLHADVAFDSGERIVVEARELKADPSHAHVPSPTAGGSTSAGEGSMDAAEEATSTSAAEGAASTSTAEGVAGSGAAEGAAGTGAAPSTASVSAEEGAANSIASSPTAAASEVNDGVWHTSLPQPSIEINSPVNAGPDGQRAAGQRAAVQLASGYSGGMLECGQFLLYLNDDTWSTEAAVDLAKEVRDSKA